MMKFDEIKHKAHQDRWLQYRFQNLLVWLFVYLVIGPFLVNLPYARAVMSVFLVFVLVSALVAMNQTGNLIRVAIAMMAVSLLIMWLESSGVIALKLNLGALAMVGFLSIVIYSLAKYLFRIRKVNANLISASLCLYLLIGLLWGGVYAVLESWVPGSFGGSFISGQEHSQQVPHHFQYFSYVTLSTLGYGDISPRTAGAAALCQMEAIIGQFFTMVVVARLVGLQVAEQTGGDS